jgi:hypothetical protein
VWYTFTGTGDQVTASLCSSAFDTQVGVFTGSCGAFTCVAGNDDLCGAQSSVTWNSVAGTTYYLYVTGWAGASGSFVVEMICSGPPPATPGNDLCANATPLTCGTTVQGSTTASTLTGAPDLCGTALNTAGGVWYTILGNGSTYTVSTCTGTTWDTKIGVFSGTCGALACVAGNDDACGLQSSVAWSTVAGTTYTIYVTGFGTATGIFDLTITCGAASCVVVPPACVDVNGPAYATVITADGWCCTNGWDALCQDAYDQLSNSCLAAPPNDACAGAEAITVGAAGACTSVTVFGTTVGAGQSGAEPSCDPGVHQDVWYTFNSGPNTSIDLSFSQGTITFTIVDLFTGGCNGLVAVDCFASPEDLGTTFAVTPNTTYHLRVSNHAVFDIPGTFSLCLTASPFITVTSKAILDGAYVAATSLMRDDLRVAGHLPLAHPYGGSPWSYAGSETIDAAVLAVSGNDAIVDWVLLELRAPGTPSTVVARRAALVQRDGDIVDTDGSGPVKFDGVAAGTYHLAVRHRNHLGAMTAQSFPLVQIPTSIDLGVPSTPTFGTNARKVIGAVSALWAGNVNGNLLINYSGGSNDRTSILNLLGASTYLTPAIGYLNADLNMNGAATYSGGSNDRTVILNNLGASTYLTPLTEQLP